MIEKEIIKLIHRAYESMDVFDHLIQALETLHADYRFIRNSHDHYLPACREYREFIKQSNDRNSKELKSIRGRLGAYSREMYKGQKKTFGLLPKLISSGKIKQDD